MRGQLWADICSDADLCLGYKCSYARDCFFMKSRKKASESQIVIGNHHLLFTDARSRMIDEIEYDEDAVLPPFQRLVIDEAHNMERNATDFFTITYSAHEMLRSIGRLARQHRNAKGLVEELAPYAPHADLPAEITGELSLLTEAIGYLETYLLGIMQQSRLYNLLIEVTMQDRLGDFVKLSQVVIAHAQRLGDLSEQLLQANLVPDELEHRSREFAVHVRRILSSSQALMRFIDFSHWTQDVYWFELVNAAQSTKGVEVHISPLSVAQSLQEALFSKLSTVVCTSATLDLHDEFSYWSSRVGLPLPSGRAYLTAVHHSPFDFKQKLLLLTPNDAPVFTEKQSDAYFAYCTETIRDALYASGGGALVLFTSYAMLRKVAEEIRPDMEKAGIALMCQGEDDRFRLLHRFMTDKDSILFATDSFWEGVDAPGDTLRLVIIVKLPFRVPSDPVFKARQEALDRDGGSGFFQLALPEATMKLKQGFGRLLRNTLDSGIVLILDSRVVNKQYGKWMLQALPESYHPETTTAGVAGKIESFLYG